MERRGLGRAGNGENATGVPRAPRGLFAELRGCRFMALSRCCCHCLGTAEEAEVVGAMKEIEWVGLRPDFGTRFANHPITAPHWRNLEP